MRGKWLLAIGAVLALVVMGAVGGMTVRAFAGVGGSTVQTKTVTKFCVYVDRNNVGDSYGDISALPKYRNRVCIAGKPGTSSVVTWNKTVAQPSSPSARRHAPRGVPPASVELAKVGPFTVRGWCTSGDGVQAGTNLLSAQDGSLFIWNGNDYPGDFDSGVELQVSNVASGSSQNPDWVNEGTEGDFSVTTADQKTAFTGFANNGVYINGPEGPACSFTGYLVVEKPSS